MPYYESLQRDIERAKEILAKGREEIPEADGNVPISKMPVIYGADIYAAYRLLESFVEVIETIHTEDYDGYVDLRERVRRALRR